MNMNDYLSELQRCQSVLNHIQTGAKFEGHLYIRRKKGKIRFSRSYKDASGKWHEKYLSQKDTDIIFEYAKEEYYAKLIPVLKEEIKALESFANKYNPEKKYNVFQNLPLECRKMVKPIFIPKNTFAEEWQKEPFSSNPFPISNSQYITKKGEAVRSRMELIIANLLFDLNIPYRYECALVINGKTIYPDFTILHPNTLEIYYIEFFGLMDDERYAAKAFKKIQTYSAEGLYGNTLFFFDHPEAPISTQAIETSIRSLFLN